jgi:predicted transcriptional regulator
MSIEDFVLRQEGIDPVKFYQLLADIKQVIPSIQKILTEAQKMIDAFEAKQKEYN